MARCAFRAWSGAEASRRRDSAWQRLPSGRLRRAIAGRRSPAVSSDVVTNEALSRYRRANARDIHCALESLVFVLQSLLLAPDLLDEGIGDAVHTVPPPHDEVGGKQVVDDRLDLVDAHVLADGLGV